MTKIEIIPAVTCESDLPLRTMCGLGPLEANVGVPTVSCPGVPLGPAGPFLRGGGVEVGSRTTLLVYKHNHD